MSKTRFLRTAIALLVVMIMPAQTSLALAPADAAAVPENEASASDGVIVVAEAPARSADEAEKEVRLSSEFFPDGNFLAYLKSTSELRGVPEGGVISTAKLESVTSITCPRQDIRSLAGVEYFPNLSYLYLDGNYIESLDLSANSRVSRLLADNNPLEKLVLNPASAENLQVLSCWSTKLSSIDTQAYPNLQELVCGSPELRQLDLRQNASLASLTYFRGYEATLDLSGTPGLRSLIWSETPVKEIDFAVCPKLNYTGLRKNELTVLDLSSNGDFLFLSAPENRLVSVHGNPAATYRDVDLRNQRARNIGVSESPGTFDMSQLDPKFGQGTVTNISGATLSGTVFSGLQAGETVRYTYTDGGLSVEAALNITSGNFWTVPPQIIGWSEGEAPNAPLGQSRYGEVTFTYGKAGEAFSATPPTQAGEWICRAYVPGAADYGALEEDVTFEITPAAANVPIPDGLTAVYRQTLGMVALPEGYAWVSPGRLIERDVGVHYYPAIYTTSGGSLLPVVVPVTVLPAYGPDECWISPITNEQEARNIRITQGTYTLVKGKDYTVTSQTDQNLVSVTIEFIGNYYGSVTKSFTYVRENAWTTPLSIANWAAGQEPAKPIAAAKYGDPVFSYLVNGAYQADPPSEPGTYKVRAEVPGTENYEELTAEVTFTIFPAPPAVPDLEATYGDKLSSVTLPAGFSWAHPEDSVGNVGTREFPASYTNGEAGYPTAQLSLTVRINPKNGEECDISPIENEYQSKHIVIRDGDVVLTKDVDYTISWDVNENVVTVIISFQGNYYGTVTRTFTFSLENKWVVEPSIENWVAGETPSTPVAEAENGTAEFAYLVNGAYQTEPPTEPGVYTLRAVVPATKYYRELSGEATFRVYRAVAPATPPLEAIYRDRLSDVPLPAGFEWQDPDSRVGDVGVNAFTAIYDPASRAEDSQYQGGPVELDVAVSPKNGQLCDISSITNEYESKHITIMDGDYRLLNGVDYTVNPKIRGNTVDVGIDFINNYYNTVVDSFSFSFDNKWIEPVVLKDWSYGEPANEPSAEALFGEPVFRYLVNGEYRDEPPTEAGSYEVQAIVPETIYYNGLESSDSFRITPALAPIPQGLTAVYRDRLSDEELPEGYRWVNPDQYVGNAGTNVFDAVYTPPAASSYAGGEIRVPVFVKAKDGNLCSISPITNDYESSHIEITDGDYQLIQGLDYDVAITDKGNEAVVTITFRGNYYSSTTRIYSHGNQNYWITRLSISNWREGDAPSTPVARARFGKPEFSYLVNGKYVSEPPEKAGEYFVRAVVPGTSTYAELTDEKNFEILPATSEPTQTPTSSPTQTPTSSPTQTPTSSPTQTPTSSPTQTPTSSPTQAPTSNPTWTPTQTPTSNPTQAPTSNPTWMPTSSPTQTPTNSPTQTPTSSPTQTPTSSPTQMPTSSPTQTPALAVKDGVEAALEESSNGRALFGPAITTNLQGLEVRYVADLLTIVPQGANGTIRITNPQGTALTRNSLVGTGCRAQLVLPDGTIVDEAIIIVRGDVLGTGRVNISQLVHIARDINQTEKLPWPYDIAAQFNSNNEIDISDLVDEASILNGTWTPTF